MTRIAIGIVAALALAAGFSAAPAQAQNGSLTRSFVSSTGVDTNPCTITAPCASFAKAYTEIGANGIIAALDPGKYGPITITGPVTINGNGWAAITAPAAGTGITINAVSGNVILTGLEIDGAATAHNGIVFNSGSSLTVIDCVMKDFVATVTTDGAGIRFNTGTSASGLIDRVVSINNLWGVEIDGTNTIAISNSTFSKNSQAGIVVNFTGGASTVSIDNVSSNGNAAGIAALGSAIVTLSRSSVMNNSAGGTENGTSGNTFYSYNNNSINGNQGTGDLDGGLNYSRVLR
jgi:hypothetical protein